MSVEVFNQTCSLEQREGKQFKFKVKVKEEEMN